jgi:hypothetical protein
MKHSLWFLRAALLGATLALFAPLHVTAAEEKEDEAKLTKAEAQKTAMTKVPKGSKVKEAGIENEDGKLVWSFDIAVPGSADITEIQVDAMTGKVVKVEKESPADQAKEKAADEKAEQAKKK